MSVTYNRRCTTCAASWPNDAELYPECPECEGSLFKISGPPMGDAEALSRKNHADFERFYTERALAQQEREIAEFEQNQATAA